MIINCSPAKDNLDETISTLDFGKRAKAIKNKAILNQEKTLEDYKRECAALAKELAAVREENERLLRGEPQKMLGGDLTMDQSKLMETFVESDSNSDISDLNDTTVVEESNHFENIPDLDAPASKDESLLDQSSLLPEAPLKTFNDFEH